MSNNTGKLIPISYVKKLTPLVVGDEWENYITGSVGFISEGDVSWFNAFNSEGLCIKSFADRPSIGKQSVGDDVIVNTEWSDGDIIRDNAGNKDWTIGDGLVSIVSWKPNRPAILKQYQADSVEFKGEGYIKQPSGIKIIINDDLEPLKHPLRIFQNMKYSLVYFHSFQSYR